MAYTIAKIGVLSIQPDFEMFLIISIPDIQSQFHLIREKITKTYYKVVSYKKQGGEVLLFHTMVLWLTYTNATNPCPVD